MIRDDRVEVTVVEARFVETREKIREFERRAREKERADGGRDCWWNCNEPEMSLA